MIAALRAYPSLRHGDNLGGWLFTIAHRKVIDAARAPGTGGRCPWPRSPTAAPARTSWPDALDDGLWARVGALPHEATQRGAAALRRRPSVRRHRGRVGVLRGGCPPERAGRTATTARGIGMNKLETQLRDGPPADAGLAGRGACRIPPPRRPRRTRRGGLDRGRHAGRGDAPRDHRPRSRAGRVVTRRGGCLPRRPRRERLAQGGRASEEARSRPPPVRRVLRGPPHGVRRAVDWQLSHGFRRSVLEILHDQIRFGQVVSYKELANEPAIPAPTAPWARPWPPIPCRSSSRAIGSCAPAAPSAATAAAST